MTTTIPAGKPDAIIHAIAVNLYGILFEDGPSWIPEDEIDAEHLADSLVNDRLLMGQYTASMLETIAAAIPVWIANNYQPLNDQIGA